MLKKWLFRKAKTKQQQQQNLVGESTERGWVRYAQLDDYIDDIWECQPKPVRGNMKACTRVDKERHLRTRSTAQTGVSGDELMYPGLRSQRDAYIEKNGTDPVSTGQVMPISCWIMNVIMTRVPDGTRIDISVLSSCLCCLHTRLFVHFFVANNIQAWVGSIHIYALTNLCVKRQSTSHQLYVQTVVVRSMWNEHMVVILQYSI